MAAAPVRVGVIGGGFGATHVAALRTQPAVQVVAIADTGSGKARAHAKGAIEYAADWRVMLGRDDIDAITVAVPPIAQREVVLGALSAGLHVFCEKPFGSCVDDAQRMRDAAFAARRVLGIDYQFRFEPGIAALRRAADAGRIGKLHAIDVCWITAGRARPDVAWAWQNDRGAGGGVINAFFSHVADMLPWITRSVPQVVSAHCSIDIPSRPAAGGTSRAVTAEDRVTALLEFDHELIASCSVTNCQPGGSGMRIELRGDRGVLTMSHRYPYRPGDCELLAHGPDGTVEPLPIAEAMGFETADTRTPAVSRCIGRFICAVRGESAPDLPTAEDGVAAHHVMEAVRESCRQRARVEVPVPHVEKAARA